MDTLFFNPPPTIRSTYNIKNKSIFYVTRKHIKEEKTIQWAKRKSTKVHTVVDKTL